MEKVSYEQLQLFNEFVWEDELRHPKVQIQQGSKNVQVRKAMLSDNLLSFGQIGFLTYGKNWQKLANIGQFHDKLSKIGQFHDKLSKIGQFHVPEARHELGKDCVVLVADLVLGRYPTGQLGLYGELTPFRGLP